MNKIITQIGILIFCCALIIFSRSIVSIEQVLLRAAAMAISIVLILSLLVINFYRIINKTTLDKSKLSERKQGN